MPGQTRRLLRPISALAILASTAALANEAQHALEQMTTDEQNVALAYAVREAGIPCATVTKSMHQGTGPSSDVAMWTVRCSDSGDLVVLVYPDADGSTGITTCEKVAKIAPCWTKLARTRRAGDS